VLCLVGALGAYGAVALAGRSGSGVSECSDRTVPVAASSSVAELTSIVVGSGLQSLARAGTADVQGLQDPGSAWSDAFPSTPFRELRPSAVVSAGYEIRWWGADEDHQAVDVFLFHGAGDARRFVHAAASPRCRRQALAYRLSQPVAARALIWTNPDGAREADVFFSRGSRAYRVVDVLLPTYLDGPFRFDNRELIGAPQLLACQLTQADCAHPLLRSVLSLSGYDALKLLAAASGQLRFEPEVEAPEIIGRACAAIGQIADPEAAMLYQGCQATLHLLDDAAYSQRCYGARRCQQCDRSRGRQWRSNSHP
jgi:hypothetical protein